MWPGSDRASPPPPAGRAVPSLGPFAELLGQPYQRLKVAVLRQLAALPEPSWSLAEAGQAKGVPVRQGVYLAAAGPSYETPAEIAMFRAWGADAVGMSTVPEVIAARAHGLRVAAISAITNVHRPGGTPTSHAEVLEVAALVRPRFRELVLSLLPAAAA
mgnify:CR=1 FL=1